MLPNSCPSGRANGPPSGQLSGLSSGARLAIFYAACFLWGGATLAFWPLFLERRGLDKSEVGTVLGVAIWLRAFATPFCASWADTHDARRRALRILALLTFVTSFTFVWARGFWGLLLCWSAFSACAAQLSPLCDSVALLLQRAGGMQYGRMRLWGSASFLAMTLASGVLLEGRDAENVVWILLLGTTLSLVASGWLPDVKAGVVATRAHAARPLWFEVLRIPHFTRLVIAVGCLQASHATYYAYGTIHWQAAGFSRPTIGALWSLGVLAEIVLFSNGDALRRRLGLHGLLGVAVVAGVVRWSLTAWCTSGWLLAPLQVLHAATFGATQICAIGIFQKLVPQHLVSTAQSLYVAVPFGLMMGSSLQIAGWLYPHTPEGAFLAMAALSALGSFGIPTLLRLR